MVLHKLTQWIRILVNASTRRNGWFGLIGAVCLLPGASLAQVPQPPLFAEQWSGWEDLGGTLFGAPECASSQASEIDCFDHRIAGVIVHSQFAQNTWSSWTDVNPITASSSFGARLECVSWGPNHLDCFARRDDNTVVRRTYDHGYDSGWEMLGGSLSSDPSCVSREVRYLDCFGRGTDGQLYRNSFNGDVWTGWAPLGGQILDNTKPSCVVFRGSLFCMTVGTDSRIQVHPIGAAVQRPAITNTVHSLGASDPSFRCVVAAGATGQSSRIECFATEITTNWVLGRWTFDGNSWSESDSALIPYGGGLLSYDFDCVAQQTQRIDCVDLIGRPDPNNGNGVIGSVVFRHVQLNFSTTANWQTVAFANSPNTGIPRWVRCTSWAAQRLDCFAAGGNDFATHLLHAALFPQPILRKRLDH
jgi:hypothetical protein